ncbi:MAG: IS110 family transposase [Terracidiphilus sp.]
MDKVNLIAMDVHCRTTTLASMTPGGKLRPPLTVPTTLPHLRAAIQAVPRPRVVVMEEGMMADWLYRNLRAHADQVIVCDPRRNALIAKDGDKDDPIDTAKLLQLARGGFLRPVHHPETQSRAILKHLVAAYYQRVELRVALANQLLGYLKQWGIVIRERQLADAQDRAVWRKALPPSATVTQQLEMFLKLYDAAARQVQTLRRRLARVTRDNPVIQRFKQIPGIKTVRAATLYVYLDTPFRFKTKQALWKYMGIGLVRRHSGAGPERLGVPVACHRRLKAVILGAAQSAIQSKNDNPFAQIYQRSLKHGKTPRIARRDTARAHAAVVWGIWKSNRDYRPDLVGIPAGLQDRRS